MGKGDWRALFKLTEKQMAKVFGPLESSERFAEAIQNFAQAVADRFGERHGRVEVSVAVEDRRKRNNRSNACRPSLARKSRNLPSNGGSALLPILSASNPCRKTAAGAPTCTLASLNSFRRTAAPTSKWQKPAA